MVTVGVAELKAKLSEYLGRVRQGEEVVVTDRGRPVARLAPMAGAGDQQLARLEREGLVRRGPGVPSDFLDRPRPRVSGPTLTEALLEERSEGR